MSEETKNDNEGAGATAQDIGKKLNGGSNSIATNPAGKGFVESKDGKVEVDAKVLDKVLSRIEKLESDNDVLNIALDTIKINKQALVFVNTKKC